jgi:SAM-dependent methyltransferase
MGVMQHIPWWVKISAKLVLSRLPIPYDFWRNIGLFRHGEMNDPSHAINTFTSYYERAKHYGLLAVGYHSLELGPGDSILSGLAARAMGAEKVWLLDAGNFATIDVEACKKATELLRARGVHAPDIAGAKSLQDVLNLSGVDYLTEGTKSLTVIPTGSIDFCWSQVVLEHVPKSEFVTFLKELRRVTKPGGIGVHSIDFRDHLGGELNNLRFPGALWESKFFSRSGFYTNRIRPREMIAMFKEAGFSVELLKETHWTELPLARNKMAKEFSHLPDEDFMVAEIDIITKPV